MGNGLCSKWKIYSSNQVQCSLEGEQVCEWFVWSEFGREGERERERKGFFERLEETHEYINMLLWWWWAMVVAIIGQDENSLVSVKCSSQHKFDANYAVGKSRRCFKLKYYIDGMNTNQNKTKHSGANWNCVGVLSAPVWCYKQTKQSTKKMILFDLGSSTCIIGMDK